jgi:3-dehydroquinate dehydratase-2
MRKTAPLNLLGTREPKIYGREILWDILAKSASGQGRLEASQRNQEGALVDPIHAAKKQEIAFIIANPAGFTRSSSSSSSSSRGYDLALKYALAS